MAPRLCILLPFWASSSSLNSSSSGMSVAGGLPGPLPVLFDLVVVDVCYLQYWIDLNLKIKYKCNRQDFNKKGLLKCCVKFHSNSMFLYSNLPKILKTKSELSIPYIF